MIDTANTNENCGALAANQVGFPHHIFIFKPEISEEEGYGDRLIMINTEITELSEEKCFIKEGCMSFRNVRVNVERPTRVKAIYYNEQGEQQEIEADGYTGRAIQHELDHLNGKVMTDYLPAFKRKLLEQKLLKRKTKL